jgi:uridine phosphorylase
MAEQILPITGLAVGSVSADVLVCGDPARATAIAARLQSADLLSDQREYRIYGGLYEGRPVTVCSHGIGAPGAAIAFEELITAGAKRITRIGTCGGMQADIEAGSLVIATAAVQNTGYGREVVPRGYPAAADPYLATALAQASADLSIKTHLGIVLTRDAFYGGVSAPDLPDYQQLSAANVLAVEMECAALFIVAALRGVRSAAILTVDGNVLQKAESMDSYQPHRDSVKRAVESSIEVALHALAFQPHA